MSRIDRREFARRSAMAGLGGVAASAFAAGRVLGAADRVRLGVIGVGNRGDQVIDAFLRHKDCEIIAISDLHEPYLDAASRKIGGEPRRFHDYRKLLDLKEVDAVVVATPDHWHALQTIHAFQAGKDVYVEKPLSLTVAEGGRMADAARRYDRVTQVGIMRRSSPYHKEAAEIVRSGGIGRVTFVRAFHLRNEWPKGIGAPADGEAPAGFDWDLWVGPAPLKRYNKNRTFYRFRWFYDYSGGQLTNFGVHYLDMIHWALGRDTPLAVAAMGGKFAIEDNREIPDTLEVMWRYPDDTLVTFTQINTNAAPSGGKHGEIEFRGTKGTLYVTNGGYQIVPESISPNEVPALNPLDRSLERGHRAGAKPVIEGVEKNSPDATTLHARNFLDCVKSRERCHCDIETGRRSTNAALIGNIALKMNALLEWDAKEDRFTNHEGANKLLRYTYRAPYVLPE